MGRIYRKNDPFWKKQFGILLKRIFVLFDLDIKEFTETYKWTPSAVNYWFNGRSLPQLQALSHLKDFFSQRILNDENSNRQFYEEVCNILLEKDLVNVYYTIRRNFPVINDFVGEILTVVRNFAKNDFSIARLSSPSFPPTGKTQVVVFSFDGTLTSTRSTKTIIERLWITLGYNVTACQELYQQFNRREISYTQLCSITEQKFSERKLNKKTTKELVSKIRLIKGVKRTFQKLEDMNIKIFIVSGSFVLAIRTALKDLCQYVEEIKANDLLFDCGTCGLLTGIKETKYDYHGKATYISEIAAKLNIAPQDILFVGDSENDRFAYTSGARTLCINPKLVDAADRTVWNNCIQTCNDLTEILRFL